jgi:hypothetical protein
MDMYAVVEVMSMRRWWPMVDVEVSKEVTVDDEIIVEV